MAADAFYSDLSEEIDFCLSGASPACYLLRHKRATNRGERPSVKVRVKSNFKDIISLCDWDINDNTMVSRPPALVLICVRLCPPGQSAQDDVCVGSVSGPGGAEPLRCLETTRHLCLQHRADPLRLHFAQEKPLPAREGTCCTQSGPKAPTGRRTLTKGGGGTAHGRSTEEWS